MPKTFKFDIYIADVRVLKTVPEQWCSHNFNCICEEVILKLFLFGIPKFYEDHNIIL